MKNPFSTTIASAGLLLTRDSDIDVCFIKLPPGMAAGYHFKDPPKYQRPSIDLPRIDPTKLNAKQQVRLSALMTHELKHHDKSNKEAYEEARKLGQSHGCLYNHLEDARIELNPR